MDCHGSSLVAHLSHWIIYRVEGFSLSCHCKKYWNEKLIKFQGQRFFQLFIYKPQPVPKNYLKELYINLLLRFCFRIVIALFCNTILQFGVKGTLAWDLRWKCLCVLDHFHHVFCYWPCKLLFWPPLQKVFRVENCGKGDYWFHFVFRFGPQKTRHPSQRTLFNDDTGVRLACSDEAYAEIFHFLSVYRCFWRWHAFTNVKWIDNLFLMNIAQIHGLSTCMRIVTL